MSEGDPSAAGLRPHPGARGAGLAEPTGGPADGPTDESGLGTLLGAAAYLLWGVFPLYFALLAPSGPLEIIGHRILWSLALCLALLAAGRRWGFLRTVAQRPRQLALLGLAGLLIAVNWTVYVAGVTTGHVTETALGYFLNPLVTVALGVLVLGERLRPLQWGAVGLGLAAALYLSVAGGRVPWIAIALALTFAAYGLLKKRAGGSLDALQSLTLETLLLAPLAVALLAVVGARGMSTFAGHGTGHALLLVSTGVATAVPLLLFGASARRVPLVTIGLLQFMAPVLQLLVGIAVMGERMPPSRWAGFAVVWVALALLTADSLAAARSRRLARAAAGTAAS